MDLFSCSAYQNSNLWDTFKNCSLQETSKNISPSHQTLTEKVKSVVFQENEQQYQDTSILIPHFPFLVVNVSTAAT